MDILKNIFASGRIDFAGQAAASSLSTLLLAAAAAAALAAGLAVQRLDVCFGVYALGVVVALAAVMPPWPMFRRHPPRRATVEDVSD
ncbi:hypothetical protein IWQ56_001219 [Coemansia nantahalensis]|nr:hypothetical protein IWQ56_001219 [Coemansia nantahalensis]